MGQVHSDGHQCHKSACNLEPNSDDSTSQQEAPESSKNQASRCPKKRTSEQEQHVRKLSNLSHRNIQLLSMKPRSEKEAFNDELRTRRRSSLINLILGAPSSGPRFSDDLCSLSSYVSDLNFGIEFFSDAYNGTVSISSSLHLGSVEDVERGRSKKISTKPMPQQLPPTNHERRSSSLGSLAANLNGLTSVDPSGLDSVGLVKPTSAEKKLAPSIIKSNQVLQQPVRKSPSLASTLASIDLLSSFEQHDKSNRNLPAHLSRPPLRNTKQTIFENVSKESTEDLKTRVSKGRVNQMGRVLRRTGSELSLYSTISGNSESASRRSDSIGTSRSEPPDPHKETKLIIMLQVCLPFIMAGFGNMAAGLVLNWVSQWRAFHHIPIFFIMLPPFVGLKGNIEMTLASRLSTLSNLNLLVTSYQWRKAYICNLILILSQAIGLSIFAAFVSIMCELLLSGHKLEHNFTELFNTSVLVVLPSALATAILLVVISSLMMSFAVGLANLIRVNPDNLSTLIAALYGDVSCVLFYGLMADLMLSLKERDMLLWPILILGSTLLTYPTLLYLAYKFKATHSIALSSIPPMLTSIIISMGSGAVLASVIDRFKLIALYQPVVNGFGANLIAVQASRVSTWLWCSALRKLSTTKQIANIPEKTVGSLAAFTKPEPSIMEKLPILSLSKYSIKFIRKILWSFCNSSPNSIAARLLLMMLAPAQSIYFIVIWMLAPTNHVILTWTFYFIYMALCLLQVSILLTICEPLMTLLMRRNLDPDIFGISLLMALADLIGTLCLAGAFYFLDGLGDVNARL